MYIKDDVNETNYRFLQEFRCFEYDNILGSNNCCNITIKDISINIIKG